MINGDSLVCLETKLNSHGWLSFRKYTNVCDSKTPKSVADKRYKNRWPSPNIGLPEYPCWCEEEGVAQRERKM
jgi:hypothetical protein